MAHFLDHTVCNNGPIRGGIITYSWSRISCFPHTNRFLQGVWKFHLLNSTIEEFLHSGNWLLEWNFELSDRTESPLGIDLGSGEELVEPVAVVLR